MARRLKNLKIDRVALVPEGANIDKTTGDGAHILLFKSAQPIAKKIIRQDGQWCVTSADGGKTFGCHDTRAAAIRQLAAVESNKHAALVHTLCEKADEAAQTFATMEGNKELRERINQQIWTLQDSVWSILNDAEADHLALLQQTVAEFSAAVLEEIPLLVTKAGRKISANRMKQLRSAIMALQAVIAEQEDEKMAEKKTASAIVDKETVLKALPEEHQEPVTTLLTELEKANTDFVTALEKAREDLQAAETRITELEKAKSEESAEEDVLKGLPEAIRKRIEEAEAKAEAADVIAKAERDARLLQEFTKQAETDLPNLPAEPGIKGRLLKAIHEKLEKEDADEVVRLLKAGSEGVWQSLQIAGHDTAPSGNSAVEKIQAVAIELRKADTTLSEAQAFERALDQNKELYAAYLNERRTAA